MKFRCLRHFCVGVPLAVHGPTENHIGPNGSEWVSEAKLGTTNEVTASSCPSVPAAQRMGRFMDYLCHSVNIKGKLASYCMRLMNHRPPHWWKGQWSWKHWPGQCCCSCFHLISWSTKNNLPEQHGAHRCASKQPQSLSCFMAETVILLIPQLL